MSEEFTSYEPKYLEEDMILSAELRERGSKCALKRLAKEKIYPKTGIPDNYSFRWGQSKKGKKKKDKMAMVIMASQYDVVVEQLDIREGKVFELEAKTKSQEEEIKLLKLKLQQWDNERSQRLQLEPKIRHQEEEIKLLQLKLKQWDNERSQRLQLEPKIRHQEEEIKLLQLKLQQWDNERSQRLQLEPIIRHQEEEIELLQQNLQQWEEKYELLIYKMSQIKSKKELLKLKVQEKQEENEQLKDMIDNYNTSCDDSKNSLILPAPVTYRASRKISSYYLLAELPNLQNDNSNYEFWAKIKNWLLKGEVSPQDIFDVVRIKCPLKAWQAIEKDFDYKDLTGKSQSKQTVHKLYKCVSEALGPGTNQFELYYYRRQDNDETFTGYLQEKFRLYCSYGVENMEPDKNDRHFLYNVMEKAAKRYQNLESLCPKSYNDLLSKALLTDNMLTIAEWNNECLNCGRKGHTKDGCRRPGGDAEVGPGQCFTCGKYGHLARNCWPY